MHIQYTSSYESCLELQAMEWAPNFHHQLHSQNVLIPSSIDLQIGVQRHVISYQLAPYHLLRRRVDLSCFVDLREVFQVDQAWKSAEIKCPMCPISTQMLIRTKPTTLILLRVSMFDWSNFFMLIIFCQRVDSILDIVCIEVSTFLFF